MSPIHMPLTLTCALDRWQEVTAYSPTFYASAQSWEWWQLTSSCQEFQCEETQMPIGQWVDEQSVVLPFGGMCSSNKGEWTTDHVTPWLHPSCIPWGEENHTQKSYILCDSISTTCWQGKTTEGENRPVAASTGIPGGVGELFCIFIMVVGPWL